ncbi:AMP-dependent synthetase/ligase [Aurantibacillus circumpalustris]|uniref:AMP-dependent synthetase/ligase n=1 Tax=Aurantibacillus circumpalustris TaxID=3036359 RepID=UPI00295BAA8B|nr:AMP-dependent synthetase/ligase [Aurantibacillus circumpalustris]
MELKRVFDILDRLKTYAPKKDILNVKEAKAGEKSGKQWVSYSLNDFIDNSNYVSAGLLHLGLRPSDTVAIMAGNCPQWNFVDFGSQQVSMPTAPIFPTISNSDLTFILNHSEAKILFISEKSIWLKLAAIEKDLKFLKFVFSFNKIEGVKHFSEFIALGKEHFNEEKITKLKNNVKEDDLMTLLYTSGTTGQPKGVMISHKNMMANVYVCEHMAPFTNKWKALSFLPLNHVYERFLVTLYLYHGVSIYYAESIETIGDNCREIHPQIFVAVPRVLERVLDRITSTGEKLTGSKKKIFDWSMRIAERFEFHGANGSWYALQRKIADELVYKKWRAAVGGEVIAVVSGGAALNPRLERIFYCAGLNLLQGYGLTETCVVLSVNRFDEDNRMFGTVGIPVENSEVKIAEEDGEILMKGPSLMMGYYKNPEATAEVIDKDGWFHTGDIGKLIEGRFLKITDRKKEIFKNSGGKYISPVLIENRLKECRYIEQCMVIGENQKFVSALIIPSFVNFKENAEHHGIEWKGNAEMIQSEELKKIIADHVKKINGTLAGFEQVKRYQLINAVWGVESGEITPKLSLRRKTIQEKNQALISKIFGQEE